MLSKNNLNINKSNYTHHLFTSNHKIGDFDSTAEVLYFTCDKGKLMNATEEYEMFHSEADNSVMTNFHSIPITYMTWLSII